MYKITLPNGRTIRVVSPEERDSVISESDAEMDYRAEEAVKAALHVLLELFPLKLIKKVLGSKMSRFIYKLYNSHVFLKRNVLKSRCWVILTKFGLLLNFCFNIL